MSFGRNIDWYRERVAVGGQVRYRYVRRFVDSTTGEDILLPTEWRRYDITAQFAFIEMFAGYAVLAVFGEDGPVNSLFDKHKLFEVASKLEEPGPGESVAAGRRAAAPASSDSKSERYIDEPSREEIEEVRGWIRENHEAYEDAFDCAVDCCNDLGIFDKGVRDSDPREDRCVATFVGGLVESFYAGSWS